MEEKTCGIYNVKITFKGNYIGTTSKAFKINSKALKKSNIKMVAQNYTGKSTNPKVTYSGKTLKKGTDYTISKLKNNKKIGEAKVTIKMKGNYSGTISTTYKIVPGKVTGVGLKSRDTSSITIKWKKVKGAQGYKVYRLDKNYKKYKLYKTTSATSCKVKRAASDTTYVYTYVVAYKKVRKKTYSSQTQKYYSNCIKPAKIKYNVTCPAVGRIRVIYSGKNISKSVQIQICINKSFNERKYEIKNYYDYVSSYYTNNPHTEFYNFSSNQNYYVRCREYTYSNSGNYVYGSWGSVKKVYIH